MYEEALSASHWPHPLELEYDGAFSGPNGDFSRWCSVRGRLRRRDVTGNEKSTVILATFEKATSYDWCLPVFPAIGSISPAPVHFDLGIPEQIVLHHDIDGVTAEEMAHGFAEYMLMVEVVKWVGENLAPSSDTMRQHAPEPHFQSDTVLM